MIKKLLRQKDEAYKKIAIAKEEIKEIGKNIFKMGSGEIFEKYPKLKSISWEQYTPYFCDGDPCEFSSMHAERYDVNGLSKDSYEYQTEDDEEDYSFNKKEFKTLTKNINKFMENFTDDDMELLFGDHVKVIITRNGVEVEDYSDHD